MLSALLSAGLQLCTRLPSLDGQLIGHRAQPPPCMEVENDGGPSNGGQSHLLLLGCEPGP